MKGVWFHGMFGGSEEGEWLRSHVPDLLTPELHSLHRHSLSELTAHAARHWAMPEGFLAGYSMGGRLALQCFLAHPQAWKGLILVSTHPGLTTKEDQEARRIQDAVWIERLLRESPTDLLEAWEDQPVFQTKKVLDFPVLGLPSAWTKKRLQRVDEHREGLLNALRQWSVSEQRLKSETCEALRQVEENHRRITWIIGQNDTKFLSLTQNVLGTRVLIPNSGHRVHVEQPETLCKAIIEAWERMEEIILPNLSQIKDG